MNYSTKPRAELFIATGCSHCPTVLSELTNQLKSGVISSLNIENIAVDNTRAAKLNIRTVPWFSFSNEDSYMIFSGNYTAKEIKLWLNTSQKKDGMQEYIEHSLTTGQLMMLVQVIQIEPTVFSHIVAMLADDETSMDIRIGLDALIEQFSSSDTLKQYSNDFKKIASEDNVRLQIDALHYIALTGDINNKVFLEEKTKDQNNQIKAAAIEAIETLNDLLD